MKTVEAPSVAEVSCSSSVFLAGRPRFRPSVALTFVAVLLAGFFAAPLTEALVVVFVGLVGTGFPPLELLVERGAAASPSEVLRGLDDEAVGSTTFFCLFVAAVFVASAVTLALRLAGAMISTALKNIVVSKHVKVRFDSDEIHKCDFRAYGASG